MGIIEIGIAVQSPALKAFIDAARGISDKGFPLVSEGAKSAALVIADKWKAFAGGSGSIAGVEPLKHPSGEYARSIGVKRVGNFHWSVFSWAKQAGFIEYGAREIDLKTTHPFGARSRKAKDGGSYLIVPFRWGTPKSIGFQNRMGVNVYSVVSRFSMTRALGAVNGGQNAGGRLVSRQAYAGGGRLKTGETFAKKNVYTTRTNGAATGNASTYSNAGMIRSAGLTDARGRKSTGGYFTFRVISSKSQKGWVVPPQKARKVTEHLARETAGAVENIIEAAWKAELETKLGG